MGLLSSITSKISSAYHSVDSRVGGILPGGVPVGTKTSTAPASTTKAIASVSPQKASVISSSTAVASHVGGGYITSSGRVVNASTVVSSSSSTSPPSSSSSTSAAVGALGIGAAMASYLNQKEAAGQAPSPSTGGNRMTNDTTGTDIMIAGRSLSSIAGSLGGGTLASIASKLGVAGAIAGGLYAGEQVLENMGVRGGAGLIGSRGTRKSRRMNVANVKALKRADRRIDGFIKTFKKVASGQGYTLQRRQASCTHKKK